MKKLFSSLHSFWALGLIATSLVTGCASINSVSLTPIPANRTREVKAQVSRTIFLAFNFDNDYLNPLVADLKRQCPNGIVSGILTKDEVISYVLVFKHQITATGFCSSATRQARRAASVEEGTSDSSENTKEGAE